MTVRSDASITGQSGCFDFCDIFDQNGMTFYRGHRNIADLIHGFQLPRRRYEKDFIVPNQSIPSGISIVPLQSVADIIDREII